MSRESYDEIHYPALPFVECHPATLETLATVFGLKPPPISIARVLELGCATGGNIVPMACALPDATFVGIDYSPSQIVQARKFADAVGVSNLRLEPLSILDIAPEFGRFDYIMTHGVFSWVPPAVQEKILRIFKDNLSENGVAYVSYNTYPGWHALEWARSLMLLHAPPDCGLSEQQRAARTREVFETVVNSPRFKDTPIGNLLRAVISVYYNAGEVYWIHELLSEDNRPMYFRDFVSRAKDHGLQYLADAHINGSFAEEASSPQVRSLLDQVGHDVVRREQYLDFLRNNTFRRSLLVHGERKVDYAGVVDRILSLFILPSLRTDASTEAVLGDATVNFRGPGGTSTSTGFPLTKVALAMVAADAPAPRRIGELLQAAADKLQMPTHDFPAARQRAAAELAVMWMARVVSLCITTPKAADSIGDRPRMWNVARYQASQGVLGLTNLRHEIVKFDPADKAALNVVSQLDGSRTRDEIVKALMDPDSPDAEHRRTVDKIVDRLLRRCLIHSLLARS